MKHVRLNKSVRLYPHQAEDISVLVRRCKKLHGALLCGEPGTGKTLESLALLAKFQVQRSLIVVPASLLHQWYDCVVKFTNLTACILSGRTEPNLKANVFIVSYGTVLRGGIGSVGRIINRKWHMIIFDEIHCACNPSTRIYRSVCRLRTKYRLLLTGTPMRNQLRDMASLANIIYSGCLQRFDSMYGRQRIQYIEWLVDNYCVRRKIANTVKMPDLSFENVDIDVSSVEFPDEYMGWSTFSKLIFLQQHLTHQDITKCDTVENARKCGPSPKLSSCLSLLKPLLAKGDSVIIFSRYVRVLNYLEARLQAQNTSYARIDGSMTAKKRAAAVAKFNSESKVLIATSQSTGEGLNLQKGSNIVILNPWWAGETQNIARCWRLGQKKPVKVFRLLSSVDKQILKVSERKSKMIDGTVDKICITASEMEEILKNEELRYKEHLRDKNNSI